MEIELLRIALEKEKKARAEAEHILENKSVELYHTIDELALANKELIFQNEEKDKRAKELIKANKEKEERADELVLANIELAFQNKEKDKRALELVLANEEKEKRADELILANTELAFQNIEKDKRANELLLANEEKEQRANELLLANVELGFQNKEKDKRAKELIFAKEEKEKRADELIIANEELAFQNKEKDDRAKELILAKEEKEKKADELIIANEELAFQNKEKDKRAKELILAKEEKEKRADELLLANFELAFQNEEKDKRAKELILANKEKEKRADELILANRELAFQNEEKDKRAKELILATKEKEKRADELILANRELAVQNEEKDKRAKELILANEEKERRANDLVIANKELAFQSKEKENRAKELIIANIEKEKKEAELILANKELGFQKEIDAYRSKMEHIAYDLTLLIDTANVPIFGLDTEGNVNEWNKTSEKITGFKKDEVMGKDLVKTYITADQKESIKKIFRDALLGIEKANYQLTLFTRDQLRVIILLNLTTRRDASGKTTGLLAVGQDITELVGYRTELELKVAERTLELNKALNKEKELSELKSRFVSTASHEFRTPLSAINFAAGSIKKYWSRMEPIMIKQKLNKIEDQVVHMTKLLDDVLIVGQADAGAISNNPVHLNLGVFINDLMDEVLTSFKESHEIELIDHHGLQHLDIFIDQRLGRNIFINLISNAFKFSPKSKKIIIELSPKKRFTVISITDFGIGISESEMKNIFKPFSRGENVDLIQGTGLGLSIVKDALDLIGGKISVTSTIGKGTSFIVKIPTNPQI